LPTDFESPAVCALHDIETLTVDIEDIKSGRKRLGEGFMARRPHRIVKLRATEIVDHRHA
jgi:hypothetical protein